MISLIAALDSNNLIGCNSGLPWNIKEDLQNFKKLTLNHTIVMGRKTFESIGRPLPKRRNVVLTRSKSYKVDGIEIVNSLEEMYRILTEEEIFIVGGSEIYKKTLPIADRLYLSHIKGEFEGDRYFPKINYTMWKVVEVKEFDKFTFKVYERV